MRSVDDRARAALECWARTLARCQASEWRIAASRATLDRPRPTFSGGAGDPLPEEMLIQARLRRLIQGGVLPADVPSLMWFGPCLEANHQCAACDGLIHHHDTEFEWEHPDGPRFFHRRCVEVWRLEDVRRPDASPWP